MFDRRRFLIASLGSCVAACTRREPPSPDLRGAASVAPAAPSAVTSPPLDASTARAEDAGEPLEVGVETWTLPPPIERAVLVVPKRAPKSERLPLVIALHGRGEAMKGPALGSQGWPNDYALVRAYRRLFAPPLTAADFEGLIEPEALVATNRDLASRPFRGVAVLCPYVPDLDLDSASDQEAYGRALVELLMPRARADARLLVEPSSTGIDGVSLGGAIALRAGLGHPEVFGAVGALQPAIREAQVGSWVALVKAARATRPAMKLRLTTSHDDYFLAPTRRLSEALRAAGIAHDFAELPGPHDYIFNRGPGSMTLLTWQDHALRPD